MTEPDSIGWVADFGRSQPTVTCPIHGSMFRLSDGRVVRGPALTPQPVYEARVSEGMIEVRRAEPPPVLRRPEADTSTGR